MKKDQILKILEEKLDSEEKYMFTVREYDGKFLQGAILIPAEMEEQFFSDLLEEQIEEQEEQE